MRHGMATPGPGHGIHRLAARQVSVNHRTGTPAEPAADLIGEALAELQRPLAHGFMADDDATCGQQFVHHPQTERKSEVEPNGVADDLSREMVAGVAGITGVVIPPAYPAQPPLATGWQPS